MNQSNNPAMNSHSTIRISQLSTQSTSLERDIVVQLSNTSNSNPENHQAIIRTPTNPIVPKELPPLENINSNNRRPVTITNSLPSYDDVIRQSSETTTRNEQSLPPPTYHEFMKRKQ